MKIKRMEVSMNLMNDDEDEDDGGVNEPEE